jgi:hypothetical protein
MPYFYASRDSRTSLPAREPWRHFGRPIGMRRRSGTFVLLALAAAALVTAACGAQDALHSGNRSETTRWHAIPAGPLSPRETALGLWTGNEVLLIGGSDAPPCPPSASCAASDEPPLADGAAFDPQTGTWRRIADSPVPFDWAEGAVIGNTAYLWIPGSPGRPQAASAFLAYYIADDRWEELTLPVHDLGWYGIAQAGERIVAYTSSDEEREQSDFLFDPATKSWSELPADPLSPSFDRVMAWSGRELVLFDHELVPNPGSKKPSVTRAAALDLESGSWRRLPDSEIIMSGPWVLDDGRLINPMLGGADGGEVDNWGRTHPYGGILDVETGDWTGLPNPPNGEEDFSAGVLTDSGGDYFGYGGWILDAAKETWIEVPPLDSDELVTGRTVVRAGTDLLVFGGARWKSGPDAQLLADAWIWSPRVSSSH